ncbi:hypothetical protein HZC34_02225 [Candidatus Saganbacteria bacterium]|nr:hypothetical protein [Candidatus Saganbacteria bacterium]
MEILGLLDSLEAAILDGFKIPLTKRLLINEEQVLILIDKIRMAAQGGSDFAKRAIDKDRSKPLEQQENEINLEPLPGKNNASEIIEQAYQIAKEVREGADKYADEILSNLELTSSRVLRTVKAGRDRLKKNVQGAEVSNV